MKLFPIVNMTAALACALLVTAPSVSAEPLHESNRRQAVEHTQL